MLGARLRYMGPDSNTPGARALAEVDDHEQSTSYPATAEPRRWWDAAVQWWRNTWNPAPEAPVPVQSGYLTLIPLSDDRLKPRQTKLTVAVLVGHSGALHPPALPQRVRLTQHCRTMPRPDSAWPRPDNAAQLFMAMLLAGMVFVLVPREVTIGEIRIFSDQMSWNSTKGESRSLYKTSTN